MKNNPELHIKLMSYLFISLPFLLITGPFFSDLAVVLICILYLLNNFKKEINEYLKNYIVTFFLFFYALCILSSLLSDYPLISTLKSIFYIRFLLLALAIVCILNKIPNTLNKLFISILICFLILIFDGLYQFIFKENIFGFIMSENRISSFFKDELIYGSYISKFFPILVSLFFVEKKKFKTNNFFINCINFINVCSYHKWRKSCLIFNNSFNCVFVDYVKFKLKDFDHFWHNNFFWHRINFNI